MDAKLFFHPSRPRTSLLLDHKSIPREQGISAYSHLQHHRIIRLHRHGPRLSASANGGSTDQIPDNGRNTNASPTASDEKSLSSSNTASSDSTTPRPPVTIRYRSRRAMQREKKRREEPPPPPPPKSWEEMTLGEKAMELYVGEKGALFWLNKFAYASIFIVIGGWIAFRFVGPALNLYQLDAPPLPPSAMFKEPQP